MGTSRVVEIVKSPTFIEERFISAFSEAGGAGAGLSLGGGDFWAHPMNKKIATKTKGGFMGRCYLGVREWKSIKLL